MNKKDAVGIMAILQTAYPSYYAKQSGQERMEAANLWAELFADDPAPVVAAAIKAIIVSSPNPFPPSIGEIKNKMHDLSTPAVLSETEAWALVSKAVRNGIYGYQDEFDKLPPSVQAAVGRPEQLKEWAVMDEDTVQSVVASNFMRGYKTVQKRERETALIPESVRELLSDVGQHMRLEASHDLPV
jgi:hypothetical protein